MFQAVIGVEQRGSLGQHYTSVPNIMKVIEPLFLNDLYEEYEKAGDLLAGFLEPTGNIIRQYLILLLMKSFPGSKIFKEAMDLAVHCTDLGVDN